MRTRYLTFTTAAAVLLVSIALADSDRPGVGETPSAFRPGEKLTFALSWGIIPAGEATLEVLPIEVIDGVATYHFVMTARTNAFIDTFYRYRGRIDAYADVDMTRSLRYLKKSEAGKRFNETQVLFDWKNQQAHYQRTNIGRHGEPDTIDRRRRTDLMPGAFDPLSVFYFTRRLDFLDNASLQRPVTDGSSCVIASAAVLKREYIRINGKAYDTLLIAPDLKHVEGVFQKSKNARIYIWITADRHRIPVKLQSRVVVGSFTGELIAAEGVDDGRFTAERLLPQAAVGTGDI
jgi:hypothetical protein